MPIDSEFWIIIAATAASLVALTVKVCFKSKCTTIKTPCLTIERDVSEEEKSSGLPYDNPRSLARADSAMV